MANIFDGMLTGKSSGTHDTGPVPVAPKAAPRPAPKALPPAGPTNKWARLAQVGIGKVNLFNAYREVAHSGQPMNANNSLLKSGAKSVNRNIVQPGITSERTTATGIARILPGGTADINAQQQQAQSAEKNVAFIKQREAAGKISQPAASKIIKSNAQTASQASSEQADTIKKMPSKGRLAAGFAGTAADIITAGKIKVEGKAASRVAAGTTLATSSGANAAAGGGTKKQILEQAAAGAALPLAGKGVARVAGKGEGILKTAVGKDKDVSGIIANTKTQSLLQKGEQANKEEQFSKTITDKSKLLPAGEKAPVKGEGFTMSSEASSKALDRGQEINRLQDRVTKFQQGKLNITPEQAKTEATQLAGLKSGKLTATQKLTGKSNEVSSAKVEEPSIEGGMTRPKAPPKEPEPLVNTNKPVKSIVDKFTPARYKGNLNPVDAAAREGHTDFANTARSVAGHKIYALRQGNNIANKFDQLYASHLAQGGTHQGFIKDVESGKLGSQAHDYWASVHQDTGKAMVESGVSKGVRDATYVGRVGQFPNKKSSLGGSGLGKTVSASKARQARIDEFGNSEDMFKTHGEYQAHVEANGGKVLTDPRDILRHTLPSKLEAIENAKGLSKFDKTAMADGRPATVTFDQSKSLPYKYDGYDTNILSGRAVHPDAVKTVQALTHTYDSKELGNSVAKVNSFTKQLVTLNGLVHGKNFGLASLRKQGAIHTATAMLSSHKDLGDKFGEDNIKRAITKGGVVPFEQSKQDMFDKLSNPNAAKSTRNWGNITQLPHNIAEGQRNVLFNKIGNHLQFSTYFNVEKQMLKKGLSQDEAARVAGSAAKNVSFISSPIETSVGYRKGARLAFFAGQYFKSTLNELTKAVGTSRDKTLSGAAQRAVQKDAVKGLARGFTYLFTLAQGINYATTGHSTFQNKDSKISPVIYVDKATGKEYHATNWFGQVGDILHLTNPQEFVNKLSPALQGISRVISNKDYSGQPVRDTSASGGRQDVQVVANFLENAAAPLGVTVSDTNKIFGKGHQPAAVTATRFLGYGTSTKDQSPIEKQIDKFYDASLPANVKTDQALSALKAVAANDIKKGDTNSKSVQELKGKITSAQFKTFEKSGKLNPATQHFNKLTPDQKMKILQKYPSKDLKNLDLTTFMTDLAYKKDTVEALHAKKYKDSQIQAVIKKTGYDSGQLSHLKTEAKKQASNQAKQSRKNPKFVSPFIK